MDMPLATKLRPPPLRPTLVPRERLITQLDRVLECQVGLVSAPAGFGKTTLVAAWAARAPAAVAWLALDEADSDPAQFLAYIIAALRLVRPGLGQPTLAMLQAPRLAPLPTLLLPLINEIEAGEPGLALVLDDYHLIQAQAVHDAVTFLIDHQPAHLRLVLATRADPPLPIARLRGRGQLVELRQADLRFTPEEAEHFLRLAAGARLSAAGALALAERTEGWAAGLQMAAASVPAAGDVDAFVRAFAGTHRHLLDYLGEEILQRQPPEVQQFLLRTSILARLCAPLCDAVLTDDGEATTAEQARASLQPSASILEQLDRANLFIAPLDDQREWYRYHQLFADLLRQRLRQAHPALVPALHRRASHWHQQHGLLPEAIHHALAAGDEARAAGLIEQAAPAAWKQGGITTLRHWLEALPEAALRARPGLCVYRALVPLFSTVSLGEAEDWLAAAAAADHLGQYRGELAVLGSLVAVFRGDLAAGLQLAQEACRLVPVTSPFFGLAQRSLSALHLLRGELDEAAAVLEADVVTSQKAGDRLGQASALRRLGSLRLMRGQLHAARELYQRSVAASSDSAGHPWPVAGRALAHLAELSYDWNDLAAAEAYLAGSLPLSAQVAPIWNTNAFLTLALLRQAQGDAAGARAATHEAQQLAAQSDTDLDDVIVAAQAARLALLQGDLAAAGEWAAQREARRAPGRPGARGASDMEALLTGLWARALEGTVLARLYLAQQQPAEACAELARLIAAAEQQARGRSLIEMLGLLALANHALGDQAAARAALERALALAEPEGFVRVFLDEGAPMADLLRQVTGAHRDFARRLLAAFGGAPGAPAHNTPDAAGPLVEPLTQRELDILRLIAQGLSNAEIGARLFLAPGTVKSYTYSLYSKLGVHSRTQAAARAGALGILRPP